MKNFTPEFRHPLNEITMFSRKKGDKSDFIDLNSDVVLESGSVLESDLSTYLEDSDSNTLDSDSD